MDARRAMEAGRAAPVAASAAPAEGGGLNDPGCDG